jgi:glycosyltransferase involved in cell wall biosynthesis
LYSKPNKQLLRRLSDRFDRVITISEYNKQYLKKDIGTRSPIEVVHMGIDPNKFHSTEKGIHSRVLTVGRFIEKKGITTGIEAFADVVERVPGAEYHIIGSGPREEEIRSTISRYGIEDHIKILGNVTDEELIREYDEAQAFLLPCTIASDGDRDGIPVVLMEAMAMKTVPVSTTVSGISELITDRKSGFLCEPDNTTCLANSLERVFSADSQPHLRKNARDVVETRFNSRFTVKRLSEAFESVVASYE